MEALNEIHQLEAALPASKSAPSLSGDGHALGLERPLPPGVAASNGLDEARPGVKTPEEMRAKIFALENEILKCPQTEIPTTHHFAPGLYMREIFVPKGTVVTGAIHKTEHLNILSQGEMSVWTEDGMKRIKASTVVKSEPGIKRAGYAHEDSVWITVCHNPSDESDTDKLEAILTTNSYQEFLDHMNQTETKLIEPRGN